MKKKIVIFDLYDTVLSDEYFVFENGLKYLYETFFNDKCSFDDLNKSAENFLPLYEKRKTDNVEICLIQDELPFIFEKYGIDFPKDVDELEYTVMNEMQKVYLTDEVKETLEKLQNEGVKMFILSNSIFTGRAAEKLLEEFGILRYFEKVFSSADYKMRKPAKKFFEVALNYINRDLSEIIYIGNDYRTDMGGAFTSGLDAIWLNVKHLENTGEVKCAEVDHFKDILKYIVQKSSVSFVNVLWTDKKNHCGIDFSKAVVISEERYIDDTRNPYLRQNEFDALRGKDYKIKVKMKK